MNRAATRSVILLLTKGISGYTTGHYQPTGYSTPTLIFLPDLDLTKQWLQLSQGRASKNHGSVPNVLTQLPVAELLRSRRTIHHFYPDHPPPHIILQAIELARWVPNHHATEPWHFYLLRP